MLKIPLLLLCLLICFNLNAQIDTSKIGLKKKYENSTIDKELKKKISSASIYPDSIVLAPLHFINTFITLDTAAFEFESMSVDVKVKSNIPEGYRFYISPFNGKYNDMQFYGGIQTYSGGKPIGGGKNEEIGRGGIFSRWLERDAKALNTDGYYASSDGEGDFISVRNKFKWDKGTYRLTLKKTGYVAGKPVTAGLTKKDLMFAWGEYEHSWITYEVENLKTKEKVTIGSLAFPGKVIYASPMNSIFLEQYGSIINFSNKKLPFANINYKELPSIDLSIGNFQINGKPKKLLKVVTHHNLTHHPDQKNIPMPIPLLSTAEYDEKTGTINYSIGKFQSWSNPKTF